MSLQPLEIASSPVLYAGIAEANIIGCILKRPELLRKVLVLSDDDFFSSSARKCFKAMKNMAAKRIPIDTVTLDTEITALYGEAESLEIMKWVVNQTLAIGGWNIEHHAELVKQASVRRQLIDLGDKMAQLAADPAEDADVIIEDMRSKLRGLVQVQGKWISIAEVLLAAYERLDDKANGMVKAQTTGITDIDRATGGLFRGELTIIGARPSVGKTACGLSMALTAAASGAHVLFVSAEMSKEQLGNRILANYGDVDGSKIRSAILEENDWDLLSEAMNVAAGLPMDFMVGTPPIEEIRNQIQNKVDAGECDLVVIDYLQLLRTKARFEKEHERIGYISRICKLMSTEFNIPVVVLAQVRRQNNGGRARCPALDELRGSGDIEQDADNVIFLHRPDDDTDPTIDKRDQPYFWALKNAGYDYIVFNIAKQRQGQVGLLGAAFNPSKMRYVSLDRMRDDDSRPDPQIEGE